MQSSEWVQHTTRRNTPSRPLLLNYTLGDFVRHKTPLMCLWWVLLIFDWQSQRHFLLSGLLCSWMRDDFNLRYLLLADKHNVIKGTFTFTLRKTRSLAVSVVVGYMIQPPFSRSDDPFSLWFCCAAMIFVHFLRTCCCFEANAIRSSIDRLVDITSTRNVPDEYYFETISIGKLFESNFPNCQSLS